MRNSDLKTVLDLHDAGQISAEAGLHLIAIEIGEAARTAESAHLSHLLAQVDAGKPGAVAALRAALVATRDTPD